MRKWGVWILVAAMLLAVPAFAGPALKGKVAVVLDVGGRGDLSFNDMGFKGTDQAAKDFGLQMTEVQSATAADYLPNIRNLARTKQYDLIICVGFLLGDALAQAAQEFPDQKFAIIDSVVDAPNVMSIVFRENEMSALVGALGGMLAAYHGYPYVGVVLGIEIPVLYHFEAGYRFGIAWGLEKYKAHEGLEALPNVGLLYVYTGTFDDIAKGKAATEAQLAQGAVAVYNVAGPLGIGDLEAITEWHNARGTKHGPPYYFGVDANQDYLGKGVHALASGMKRVDVGCYDAVKAVVEGTFQGGVVSLGLAEGGVSISGLQDLIDFIEFGIAGGALKRSEVYETVANWATNRAAIPYWIWEAVDELEKGILNGTIQVPTANTRDEMLAIRAQYPLTR
ncbi:BMP family ABC transporter substrate-binding protein [Candidatus Bipolaricaulota bacterium]|nr:BMP family ABC transporter substrate-binding protein [Candidatus Bipolaricaulota bacterium]